MNQSIVWDLTEFDFKMFPGFGGLRYHTVTVFWFSLAWMIIDQLEMIYTDIRRVLFVVFILHRVSEFFLPLAKPGSTFGEIMGANLQQSSPLSSS